MALDAERSSCGSRSAGILKSMPFLTIRTAIEAHGEDYSPIRRHCPPTVSDALHRLALQRLPLHVLEQLEA